LTDKIKPSAETIVKLATGKADKPPAKKIRRGPGAVAGWIQP